MPKSPQVILASSSPNRALQLKELGISYHIQAPKCDEAQLKRAFNNQDIHALALHLAKQKALSIEPEFKDIPILAADQICALGKTYFDKPLTHENAVLQLKSLQGQTHEIISGLAIIKNKQTIWEHIEVTSLQMRPLSDDLIEAYVTHEKPYHSCGSYHFETNGKWLFEHIQGLESNIVGLPLPILTEAFIQLKLIDLMTIFKNPRSTL